MMVCFKEVKGDIDISQLKKVKQPLFKTEDGVSLMEGENCFYIVIHVMGWDIIEAKVSNDIFTSSNVKIFSKKEAARDFVLMNKPVLSINDVMGWLFEIDGVKNILGINKIKHSAKSKIEGKWFQE